MKQFMLCLVAVFLLTFPMSCQAGEYNVPFWQNDAKTHTFISILNPTSASIKIDVTVKNDKGVIVHTESKTLLGGKAWYIDTASKSFQGFGTINIFVNDSVQSQVPLAVTAMLYGQYNLAVQVWKY